MDVTPTISLLELVWTLQAIFGLAVMAYTAYDNRLSLKALRSLIVNGFGELTASIGFWDGVAGVAFHLMFLIIGLAAMAVPPAPNSRQFVSQLFGWSFVLGQSFILGIQIRNQLARLRMRGVSLGGLMGQFLTPQLQAALLRAVGLALVVFVGTAGVALATGRDWKIAVGLGLAAVATAFGWRSGEGIHDSQRAARGDVRPSDVQGLPAPGSAPQS